MFPACFGKDGEGSTALLQGVGCALYQIPYTLEELEYYVGKRVGILAVIDKNFGRTICAKLPDGQQLAAIDCTSR